MKKALLTLAIALLAMAAQAQIKMHQNGYITFQTLSNTTTQGVSIGPAPYWTVNFNGNVHFKQGGIFIKDANNYDWMNCSKPNNYHVKSWVVTYPDWDTHNFYVYGNGNVYSTRQYTIGNRLPLSKGAEAIDGKEAISIITGIKGYYYKAEEQDISGLENDEFVNPEAVEAMIADTEKRTAGLSGSNLEEVFPEAVRTDPQNRLCIDYQSVVTLLVEAVKKQQEDIELLRKALEEHGLMEPRKP